MKIDASGVMTVKSETVATSAPWPAEAPSTPVITGTWPEQRTWARRSVGERPPWPPAVGR